LSIDVELATALQDLALEPLDGGGEPLDDSLVAGYGMHEVGASFCNCCAWLCCCCSCGGDGRQGP
jgi:hypothetical protein